MNELNLVLLIFGGLILLLGLVSRPIRHVPLSEPLVALVAGILIGPSVLGLLDLGDWGDERLIIGETARITLAIGVMAIALRLSREELIASSRSLALLLAVVMPLMWLVSGFLGWLLLGLPLAVAALVGAAVTPTDPIVASTIVAGRFAEERLPGRLRRTISAESGFNDGLALPFVTLPLLLLAAPPAAAVGEWLLLTVGWSVGGAVIFGVLAGYGAGRALRFAEQREAIEHSSFLAYTLVLSLAVMGGGRLIGTEGILAVFVAGLAFDAAVSNRDRLAEERVQEAVNRLFILPVFVLIGMALPWVDWLDLGWPAAALAVAILLLRRLPAVLLAGRIIPDLRDLPDAAFAGWFGPIGVAAIYYAAFTAESSGNDEIWTLVTLIVSASIVVHGLTASPFIRLYARLEGSASGRVSR